MVDAHIAIYTYKDSMKNSIHQTTQCAAYNHKIYDSFDIVNILLF